MGRKGWGAQQGRGGAGSCDYSTGRWQESHSLSWDSSHESQGHHLPSSLQCHSSPPPPSPPPPQSVQSSHCPPPPSQLVEKRFLALREESVQAPPSHGAPRLDSKSSESEAGQVAQSRDHGPKQGVSDEASPPEIDFKDPQRPRPAEAHLSRPKAFAVSSGHRESPPRRAPQPRSAPHGHSCTSSSLRPRDAPIPRETAPFRKTHGPADWSSEEEEELPSLSFLLDSQKSLLPWGFSLSPVSASGRVFPGGRGSWGAPQALSPQRIGLSRAAPPVAKSRKCALGGGPAPAGKSPLSGTDLGVSGRPALALGLVRSSQPQKRKCGPLLSGRRRKRHCSP